MDICPLLGYTVEQKFLAVLIDHYAKDDIEISIFDTEAKLAYSANGKSNAELAKFSRYALEQDTPLVLASEDDANMDNIIYTAAIKPSGNLLMKM